MACDVCQGDSDQSGLSGHTVNGRRTSKTMKGKSEKAPEKNWVVAENTHETLTTPVQWENVQKQIAVRSRACKDGKVESSNLFRSTRKDISSVKGKVCLLLCEKM